MSGALGAGACGGSDGDSTFNPGDGTLDAGNTGDTSTPPSFGDDDGSAGDATTDGTAQGGQVLSAVHIVPADASLAVTAGTQASLTYKVMGIVDGAGPEIDVTSRFVFYVPDNYLVGGFPTTGAPGFSTRLPVAATDPPQQGGKLTVQAQAANPDGSTLTTTTSLTVKLSANLVGTSGAALPAHPETLFGGTVDATIAPQLAYPNDGAMLPPNLKRLEVHWKPASAATTLYRITFTSSASSIVYYTRCGTVTGGSLVSGACGFELDATGYGYLAQSNAGQGNVTLTIDGTDDAGTKYGTSSTFNIQFAQEAVNGGVYYWNVTDTQIMRFDFGGTQTAPDIFIGPKDFGTDGTCIGCHTLSPDGTKIAASLGGQNDGRIVYLNDLSKVSTPPAPARTDANYLTLKGDNANAIQFASFNPAGDRFVSVYGDTDTIADRNKLYFSDGTTGKRLAGSDKALTFEPDHPAWSPDGKMIAMTHVGAHHSSQREYSGGIDVATFTGTTLGDPVVVIPGLVPGKNRYNPSFVPDSSFFVYSESTCTVGKEIDDNCDSDVAGNLNATTWAVKPAAGATAIHLDNAGKAGVADKGAVPLDTFPRTTPFKTAQGSGQLFWFTVASQRAPGLRQKGGSQQLLWMFAIDPAKILAGGDGSFTGFVLPFQNMGTSNHIAQWTQKIVAPNAPPPAPPPPPPPPPPAPPPAVPVK